MSELAATGARLRRGTRVCVTGAGRGIGRAVAERFAAEGGVVTIADIDGDAAEVASQTVAGSSAARLDVTDAAAVRSFFDGAPQAYEVIVANAGVGGPRADVVDVSFDEWQRVVDVNLTGVFNTIRHGAGRLVREGRPGRVIVTASIAGLTAEAGAAAYCASKWGVIGLLKSAALELAPRGILVNGVCPGDVDTDLLAGMVEDRDAYPGPLGRSSQPAEIAGVYTWLASPDASFMVGATVVIDGGLVETALIH